jgi:hypothetical protein
MVAILKAVLTHHQEATTTLTQAESDDPETRLSLKDLVRTKEKSN